MTLRSFRRISVALGEMVALACKDGNDKSIGKDFYGLTRHIQIALADMGLVAEPTPPPPTSSFLRQETSIAGCMCFIGQLCRLGRPG
jgi:hypothetical protein